MSETINDMPICLSYEDFRTFIEESRQETESDDGFYTAATIGGAETTKCPGEIHISSTSYAARVDQDRDVVCVSMLGEVINEGLCAVGFGTISIMLRPSEALALAAALERVAQQTTELPLDVYEESGEGPR